MFELLKTDPSSQARLGRLTTGHGVVETPIYMPVGTQATVKALPQILDWIDAENARREKSRKKRIRIVQAPALAIEQLPKGLGAWLSDATAGARALPGAIASVLP